MHVVPSADHDPQTYHLYSETQTTMHYITRAQQLLRWATVPDQSGPKNGGVVPLSVGAAGSPSNTMSPGPRSTSVLSCILIHPPVGHNTPTLSRGSRLK